MIRRNLITVILVLAAAAVAHGQATQAASDAAKIDKGDFKVGFSPKTKAKQPKKAMPPEVAELVREIATEMNKAIALPSDVYLNFDVCGEPNAFYNPETKEITMCYEFVTFFEETFKKANMKQAEIDKRVDDSVAFFFFHELGHCLIDVWDIPATGREEDAVDQLAAIILLDGSPEGVDMVISAAIFFDITASDTNKEDLAFWDEHSVDEQRMYDTLCLTFGSNPSKNKTIVASGYLPADRAGRCSDEYRKINHAWERLLEPYVL